MAEITTNFAALAGKKHNYGNKTSRICYEVGVDKVGTAMAYGFEERQNRNNPGGDLLLYLVCEFNGKKGFTVRCNDEDYVKYILANPGRNQYAVTFTVREFEADQRKQVYPEMTGIQ